MLADPATELGSVNSAGKTPLHEASEWAGNQEVIRLYVKDKRITPKIINCKDNSGSTAAMAAVCCGHIENLEALAKCPYIDWKTRDKDGRTLLQAAENFEHFEIVQFLEQKIFDSQDEGNSSSDNSTETETSEQKSEEMIQTFIKTNGLNQKVEQDKLKTIHALDDAYDKEHKIKEDHEQTIKNMHRREKNEIETFLEKKSKELRSLKDEQKRLRRKIACMREKVIDDNKTTIEKMKREHRQKEEEETQKLRKETNVLMKEKIKKILEDRDYILLNDILIEGDSYALCEKLKSIKKSISDEKWKTAYDICNVTIDYAVQHENEEFTKVVYFLEKIKELVKKRNGIPARVLEIVEEFAALDEVEDTEHEDLVAGRGDLVVYGKQEPVELEASGAGLTLVSRPLHEHQDRV